MILEKYIPRKNSVLVKHSYSVNGFELNAGTPSAKETGKVIVAVGPDSDLKVGQFVQCHPHPMMVIPVFIQGNEYDFALIKKKAALDAKNRVLAKEYVMVAYMIMFDNDIIALVNDPAEETQEDTSPVITKLILTK